MTKPILSAVRGQNPSKTSPCSRCQHAESIHAYAGPCLFHDCECPFFIPEAEPDVEVGREPEQSIPRRAKPASNGAAAGSSSPDALGEVRNLPAACAGAIFHPVAPPAPHGEPAV
jgi:hypothetical protein